MIEGGRTMDPREISVLDYDPRPQLVTKVTEVDKAKFPAIDGHNHLRRLAKDPKATVPTCS